jgi:hypothetical protein
VEESANDSRPASGLSSSEISDLRSILSHNGSKDWVSAKFFAAIARSIIAFDSISSFVSLDHLRNTNDELNCSVVREDRFVYPCNFVSLEKLSSPDRWQVDSNSPSSSGINKVGSLLSTYWKSESTSPILIKRKSGILTNNSNNNNSNGVNAVRPNRRTIVSSTTNNEIDKSQFTPTRMVKLKL